MAEKKLRFSFLKESKGSGGVSEWSPFGRSPRVFVESISVETVAEVLEISDAGKDPKIIPFGVKGDGGRVANITGTFENSMDYVGSSDAYLDVLQDTPDILGRGLRLYDTDSQAILPELGTPSVNWRIDSFDWDREARRLGQWKFKMTLSYVWKPSLNEIKLYANGVGTNVAQNVKFSASVGLTGSGYNKDNVIYKPKISTTIHDLNRATFQMLEPKYNHDDLIHIYCETSPSKAVFFGVVDDISTSSNGTITYSCIEIGDILQRVPCAKMGSGGFFKPKIKILNPYEKDKYRTLSDIITLIVELYDYSKLKGYSPGNGVDKTKKWGGMSIIPGTGDTNETGIRISSQLLSGENILTALMNVIEKQCGLNIWFDNDNGKMEYGYVRDYVTLDVTKEYITSTQKTNTKSIKYDIGYVVIFDSEGTAYKYPSSDTKGTAYAAYQIDTVHHQLQMQSIAARVHADLNVNRDTYNVYFPAGTVKFKDGDVFMGLGDQTSDPVMDWKGDPDTAPEKDQSDSVWQIKEMEITDTYTMCKVGASYYSIFDIYKSSLKPCSQVPPCVDTKDRCETANIQIHSSDYITATTSVEPEDE